MHYGWEWKSHTSIHPSATRTQRRPPKSIHSTKWTQVWLLRLWPPTCGKSRVSPGPWHGGQWVAEPHWWAPQDLSSHCVLTWSITTWCCQTEMGKGELINQQMAAVGCKCLKSAWSPPLPPHMQQKWCSLLLTEDERAENSNFNILLKITDTAVPPRFSASFPPCYNSFFNITVSDFDCQTLSCGEATRPSSRCTAAVLLQLTHAFWL